MSSRSSYTGNCLHCNNYSKNVQVSCDDCNAYICQTCHWCHEYQGNHEIRVCDRCDAFYCRSCDEMDVCSDCLEVVCGGCTTLMSCKFCGAGLCEDCAVCCGRCGIVLCKRDAKFAVECDTCKLSYCLVCLAQGTGNKGGGGVKACVRCHARPSKRVEQLVHLRLKSIYKAFKSTAGFTDNPMKALKRPPGREDPFETPLNLGNGKNDINTTHSNNHNNRSSSSSGRKCFDAMMDSDNGFDNNSNNNNSLNNNGGGGKCPHIKIDKTFGNASSSQHSSSNSHTSNGGSGSPYNTNKSKQIAHREKLANEAAAALLAELDAEDNMAKKKKSKKKKGGNKQNVHPQANSNSQDQNSNSNNQHNISSSKHKDISHTTSKSKSASSPSKKDLKNGAAATHSNNDEASSDEDSIDGFLLPNNAKIKKKDAENGHEEQLLKCINNGDAAGIELILEETRGVPGKAQLRKNAKKALKKLNAPPKGSSASNNPNHHTSSANNTVNSNNNNHHTSFTFSTIHDQLASLLPKNSTLLKWLSLSSNTNTSTTDYTNPNTATNNTTTTSSTINIAKCRLKLHPLVVGWVIGRKGAKIKEVMERSGTKVWIDQVTTTVPNAADGMEEYRVVYITGNIIGIELAVGFVVELVVNSPTNLMDPVERAALRAAAQANAAAQMAAQSPPILTTDIHIATDSANLAAPQSQSAQSPGHSTSQEDSASITTHTNTVYSHSQVLPEVTVNSSAAANNLVFKKLTCPPQFVPLLIGKRGWTIQHIQEVSGARVDIDQSGGNVEEGDKIVVIKGLAKEVETATRMVQDVLNYPYANIQYSNELNMNMNINNHTNNNNNTADMKHTTMKLENVDVDPPEFETTIAFDDVSDVTGASNLASTTIANYSDAAVSAAPLSNVNFADLGTVSPLASLNDVSYPAAAAAAPKQLQSTAVGGANLYAPNNWGGYGLWGSNANVNPNDNSISQQQQQQQHEVNIFQSVIGTPASSNDIDMNMNVNMNRINPNMNVHVDNLFAPSNNVPFVNANMDMNNWNLWGAPQQQLYVNNNNNNNNLQQGLQSAQAQAQAQVQVQGGSDGVNNGNNNNMDELTAFLQTLNLSKYAPILQENEVDLAVLPLMKEVDLAELGIPKGPRLKILRASAGSSARVRVHAGQV